jgi:hypothetical protein
MVQLELLAAIAQAESGEVECQQKAAVAYPPVVGCRNSNDDLEGPHVSRYHSACANKRILANFISAHDGRVRADRCALSNDRFPVLMFPGNMAARVVYVRKHHARSAKNVVLEDDGIVNRNIVLYPHVVADDDIVANENVLPKGTVLPDAGTRTDVGPMPDSGAVADLRARIDNRRRMEIDCHS